MTASDQIYNCLNFDGIFNSSKNNLIKIIKKIENKKNVRICLHKNNQSSLHIMLIKFNKSKINKMHYHKNKNEFYFILKGKLDVIVKKNTKKIHNILKENDMIYLESKTIHSVKILTEEVIFLEIRPGPFNRKDSILV